MQRLPITRTQVGDLPAVVLYWCPGDELAVLNTDGSIALWLLGVTMRSVALEVETA